MSSNAYFSMSERLLRAWLLRMGRCSSSRAGAASTRSLHMDSTSLKKALSECTEPPLIFRQRRADRGALTAERDSSLAMRP